MQCSTTTTLGEQAKWQSSLIWLIGSSVSEGKVEAAFITF
jgi:hypothetical protein